MTPETNILGVVSDLWVEKFPENHTLAYPKGLVKRISTPLVNEKSRSLPRQYNSRIRILWYADDSRTFDAKMESVITAMLPLTSETKIKNVTFETRDDGYDPVTDKHVMSLDFFIKHNA